MGPTVGVAPLRAYVVPWPAQRTVEAACSRPVGVYSQRRCDHAVPACGLAARVAASVNVNPSSDPGR